MFVASGSFFERGKIAVRWHLPTVGQGVQEPVILVVPRYAVEALADSVQDEVLLADNLPARVRVPSGGLTCHYTLTRIPCHALTHPPQLVEQGAPQGFWR